MMMSKTLGTLEASSSEVYLFLCNMQGKPSVLMKMVFIYVSSSESRKISIRGNFRA